MGWFKSFLDKIFAFLMYCAFNHCSCYKFSLVIEGSLDMKNSHLVRDQFKPALLILPSNYSGGRSFKENVYRVSKESLTCISLYTFFIPWQLQVCCGGFFFLYSYIVNPLTPKIKLLILPSSCYTFPCKVEMRIWC